MIILHILLWIFLILLILLLLLIFVPIRYQVQGKFGFEKKVMAKASWMFFVRAVYENSDLSINIGPYKLPLSFDDSPSEEEPSSQGFALPKLNFTKLNIKSIASLGIILIKKLWKKIKPQYFYIKGIVGFDDPCTTGQFVGFYEICANTVGFRKAIDLKGDFSGKHIELDMKMNGGFAIASLAGPVIWFIWQKPVRDGIKLLRKGGTK